MSWLKKFFSKINHNIILGRWRLKYDEKLIDKTVYLSNIDNCGCCFFEKKI